MARKKSKQRSGQKPLEPVTTRPLELAVFAVYALVAVAAFLPRAQLWGVNHLAFYPLPVKLAALVLMGVAFVPPLARRAYSALLELSRVLEHGGPRVDLILALIAAAAFLLFAQFRTATNLLGDGQLIAQSFDAAWDGNDRVIMRSARAIFTEERIAPGATLLYYGAAKAVAALFHKGPAWGIRLVSYLLGALFVYVVLRLARRGSFSPDVRPWLLVLTLFSATIQLFFGYVENYAPVVFFGFLYVLAGIMAVHGGTGLIAVITLFGAAFYAHIQAVLLVPSLLYVVLWRVAGKRRARVERYAFPVIVALILGIAYTAGYTTISQYYLPLHANEQSYGLFSFLHIADILNEILILLPMAPLFIVMSMHSRIAAGRQPDIRGRQDKNENSGWLTSKAEWHFAYLTLIPCLAYLLLFKPEIGMARDWDLFTMTSLGFVPLALLVLHRFYRVTKTGADAAATFVVPATVVSVVLCVSWVGINASDARSTARFERILEYDKTHASYAYENLSIFYYTNNRVDKAAEMMEIACDISHNPRQYLRLAMLYDELGRRDDALELVRATTAKHPDNEKARFYYISLLEKEKLYDELLEVARDGTKYQPREAIYWFYLGEVSIKNGDIEEGLAAYRNCLDLDPPPKARTRCIEQIAKYSGEE